MDSSANDNPQSALAASQLQAKVTQGFEELFGHSPAAVSRAPGRLEILGNHTDYNEGVVLSTAVDRATFFAAAPSQDSVCRLIDLRSGSRRSFALAELDTIDDGDWANYIKGILIELRHRGLAFPAFSAALISSVPLSAGMSSSAALEMAAALAVGSIAGIDLPWVEWAKIGQTAENKTVGANTGLLDQFSSLRGKKGQLVFSDFRSLDVHNVPLPAGTALIVANSMVKHNLTGEYNERRQRCEQAVEVLSRRYDHVAALRDVTLEQLDACKDEMHVMAYRRARHVVSENERVFNAVQALGDNDLPQFGQLMFESHESSRVSFENSCPELDSLVEIGKSLPGAIGARLSGGGFGGITVHMVRDSDAEDYARRLETAYQKLTQKDPAIMVCHADDGAQLIPL